MADCPQDAPSSQQQEQDESTADKKDDQSDTAMQVASEHASPLLQQEHAPPKQTSKPSVFDHSHEDHGEDPLLLQARLPPAQEKPNLGVMLVSSVASNDTGSQKPSSKTGKAEQPRRRFQFTAGKRSMSTTQLLQYNRGRGGSSMRPVLEQSPAAPQLPGTFFGEGLDRQTVDNLTPRRPPQFFPDVPEEEDEALDFFATGGFRAPKLAKKGSHRSSWAAPQPPSLKRGESWSPPVSSPHAPATPPTRPSLAAAVSQPKVSLKPAQLLSDLKMNTGTLETEALANGWKQLRALFAAYPLDSRPTWQEDIVSLFSSALRDDKYPNNAEIGRQLLLTMLTTAFPPTGASALYPLLEPLVEYVQRLSHHHDLQELSVMIIHSVLTCPGALITGNQPCPNVLVRHLLGQTKRGRFCALPPLAHMALHFWGSSSWSSIHKELLPLLDLLWQLLRKPVNISVVQASVALLAAATPTQNTLTEDQVLRICGLFTSLQSPEAERAGVALLVNHNWDFQRNSTQFTIKRSQAVPACILYLGLLVQTQNDCQSLGIAALTLSRKLIHHFAEGDMLAGRHYDVIFKSMAIVLSAVSTNDDVVHAECCQILSCAIQAGGTVASQVLVGRHIGTFNQVLEATPRLVAGGDQRISQAAVNMLVQLSSHASIAAAVESLHRATSRETKLSLLRVILNSLQDMTLAEPGSEKEDEGGKLVATILKVMSEHEGDERIAELSCAVFSSLYAFNRTSDQALAEAGSVFLHFAASVHRIRIFSFKELDCLLTAMKTYPSNSELQRDCTSALLVYFEQLAHSELEPVASPDAVQFHQSIVERVLDLVLERHSSEATKSSSGDVALLLESIKMLCGLIPLADLEDDNMLAPNLSDIVSTLVDWGTLYLGDEALQTATLKALRRLVQFGEIAELVESSKGLIYLLCCIRDGGQDSACLCACQLLHDLVRHDALAVGEVVLQEPSGPTLLVDCMEQHPNVFLIQDSLCAVFEAITRFEDDLLHEKLEDHDNSGSVYLHILLHALEHFAESKTLVRSACKALAALLAVIDSSVLWRQQTKLCACLARALACMQGHPIAEEAILELWLHLCHENDAFRGGLAPFLPPLFDSMRDNLANAPLCRTACQVLQLIAQFEGPSLAAQHPDGLKLVIDSLLYHARSTQHVQKLLKVLVILAANHDADNLQPFAQHRVEGVVLCVTKIHIPAKNPLLVSRALSVLNNLLVASGSGRPTGSFVYVLSERVLRFIIWSMTQYKTAERVQASACQFLYNQWVLHENDADGATTSILHRHARYLCPLLQKATERFPETCSQRADLLLYFLSQEEQQD